MSVYRRLITFPHVLYECTRNASLLLLRYPKYFFAFGEVRLFSSVTQRSWEMKHLNRNAHNTYNNSNCGHSTCYDHIQRRDENTKKGSR